MAKKWKELREKRFKKEEKLGKVKDQVAEMFKKTDIHEIQQDVWKEKIEKAVSMLEIIEKTLKQIKKHLLEMRGI